jgi:hypothetical protein
VELADHIVKPAFVSIGVRRAGENWHSDMCYASRPPRGTLRGRDMLIAEEDDGVMIVGGVPESQVRSGLAAGGSRIRTRGPAKDARRPRRCSFTFAPTISRGGNR